MASWGFRTATHSRGTAGTATGTNLAANPARRYLLIRGDLEGPSYIALGGAASVESGAIPITGKGTAGSEFEMSTGKANVYSGAVEAIAPAGTAYLSIVEGV